MVLTEEIEDIQKGTPPGDKLLDFYNAMVSNKNIKGLPSDYGAFKAAMDNPDKARAFYTSISKNENIKGIPENYELFSLALGLKKKAPAAVLPNGSNLLQNGGITSLSSPQNTEPTPVLPQFRKEVADRQQSDQKKEHDVLVSSLEGISSSYEANKKKRDDFIKEIETNPNAPYYQEKIAEKERNRYKGTITLSDRIHSVTGDIYNGLGDLGKGIVRFAGEAEKQLLSPGYEETVVDDIAGRPTRNMDNLNKRVDYDVNWINDKIEKVVDWGKRKGTSDEIGAEKKAAINEHPINGLISGLAEFAPAIATASRTGGLSFFFNDYERGYENIDRASKENNLDLTESQKQLYATTQGIASALLMTHNLHSLLGKASEKTTQGLIDKISMDAMENMAKSGEDFTGANIKKAVEVQLKTLEDKVKNYGIKAVVSTAKSVGDLAALEGAKIATDKLTNTTTGKQVFDMSNQAERMREAIKTGLLFGVAGSLLKAPEMLAKGSKERNSVIESIYNDPSPENIERIKTTVANRFREQHEDAQQVNALVDQISNISKSIPKGLPIEKQLRVTDLILERKQLEQAKEENAGQNAQLDEAFGEQHKIQDEVYQDRIDSINDEIKSVASGEPIKYFKDKENGEPMKQFGNDEPEKISENRYYTEKPYLAEERTISEPINEQATTGEESKIGGQAEPTEPGVEDKTTETVDITPIRQKAIDAVTHGIVYGEHERFDGYSARFDFEMTTAEKKKAVRDIKNGNFDSAPAKKMLAKLEEWDKNDSYPIIQGSGGHTIRDTYITSAEIQQSIDEAKAFKLGELTPSQIEEINRPLAELGFTHKDFEDYERYRAEQTNSGATTSDAENVQRPENDRSTSDTQNASGKNAQGEPGKEQRLGRKKSWAEKTYIDKNEGANFVEETAKAKEELQKAGDPLRSFATKVREGKINKLGGFKAGTGFDAVWDASLEVVASTIEGGAKLADAIEAGLNHVKKTDWYKNLNNKSEFDEQYRSHLDKEYRGGDEPIGISKEETRKQRELRGQEDLPESEKTTLLAMFDSGKDAVETGLIDPVKLAIEVSNNPRNLSPEEVNALLFDRQRIRQELEDIYKKPSDTLEGNILLSQRQQFLENALEENERAVKRGANKNALALVAMQNMINSDFSLATQRARMRRIVGGELTPEMTKEIERYSKELDEANKKLADYEKRLSEISAKKIYDKERVASRKAKKQISKEGLIAERKVIISDFLKDLEKIRKSGSLQSDVPYRRELAAAVPFIKRMLTNLSKDASIEFKDAIATIHEAFAEHIDGLKERDIMDVLSGKYNERKETKNELIETRNNIVRMARLTAKLEDLKNGIKAEKSERKLIQKQDIVLKLEAEIRQLEKQLGPTKLERDKQSLQNRIERINQRIKDGDFETSADKPIAEIDAESITLKAKVRKAQNNFNAMAERLSNHRKGLFEKSLDTFSQIRRAVLLSGVKTLGKLYSFATARSITTPIEEAVNSLNSKIPGLSKIAKRSPRFSGGFSPKAEALAISTRWSKATLKDSWVEVLKTGQGELDRLYGKSGKDKDFDLNPSALEFFGRLHGAFKNSTKRAEFFRSFQKRLQHAAEHGEDINDPNVQFSKALEAYADGKRAILMNDNILVDKGYKNLLRGIEQDKGIEGKTLATVIRALFPIVKIPTNYVLETYDVVTGAVPGLSRATPYIAKAMIDGAATLSPKQADMVMRTLVKGQIGLAAMIIAYNNPQMFGGYYSGKRKEDDLKSGAIIIDGHELPHFMAHNPIFEAMQIAATMRRAIDSANGNGASEGIMNELTTSKLDHIKEKAKKLIDKNNPETQIVEVKEGKVFYEVVVKNGDVTAVHKEGGIKQGVLNSAKGLLEQIPFTSAGDLLNNSNTPGNIAGTTVRNLAEPRLLQEIAEFSDKDDNGETTKRDPQNFTEQLKTGIPGLRQQVGEKPVAVNKKTSTIKLSDGTVFILSKTQIEEREKINDEFIKKHEAAIRKKLKGKTEHDIQLRIQTLANDYSKIQMLKKYRISKGKYSLKQEE